MTINKNLISTKKYASWFKKLWQDIYQQVEDSNKKDEKKDNNNIFQIMWTDVPL